MAKTGPFEQHAGEYEAWFERHKFVYESELLALKAIFPVGGLGVEIGVGTGRFAVPLGIPLGVDPSLKMCAIARDKGIDVINGVAEALPLGNGGYDVALLMTTVCFVDSLRSTFEEIYRILKPEGVIIIGFIDKNSPLGKDYEKHKLKSTFYRDATFYSVQDVALRLVKSGFDNLYFLQTIYQDLDKITAIQPTKEGYGEGAFVVLKGTRGDWRTDALA